MYYITTKEQLISNIERVENCLVDGTDQDKMTMVNLIRRGMCLVAYKIHTETRFAPSRFLGYKDNNIQDHNHSSTKDGRLTNIAIHNVLGKLIVSDDALDRLYSQYCRSLGVQPTNYTKRKYWYLEIEAEFPGNIQSDGDFPEGKIIERIHKNRERNSQVTLLAKANFKSENGRLYCQVCGFDFEEKYGETGIDYIEAHHTIAVSEMQPNHRTRPSEIALLCANCHRMVHRRRPWLSMEQLSMLVVT